MFSNFKTTIRYKHEPVVYAFVLNGGAFSIPAPFFQTIAMGYLENIEGP